MSTATLHPALIEPQATAIRAYCPCCDAEQEHALLLRGTADNGTIYRCASCGLRRLLPLPDPVADAQDGYGMYANTVGEWSQAYAAQVDAAVAGYLKKLEALSLPARTMLDMGGGMGYYSRAFARRGVKVTYIDRDPVSINFARPHNDRAGVETIAEPIEQFTRRSERRGAFDLIFFRHVIEHCHHPHQTLHLARALCRDAGMIVIETDNNRSVEHLLHPYPGWYWQDLYRHHYCEASLWKLLRMRPLAIDKSQTHYYAFRRDNLCKLVERCGWRVVDSFAYMLGDRTYWPNIPRPSMRAYWRLWGPLNLLRCAAHFASIPLIRRWELGAGLAVFATPDR